jgi:hypothetical protein
MTSASIGIDHDPTGALFDAVDAAVSALLATDPTRRSTAEQKQFLVRTQRLINRLPALQHREIVALKQQASAAELGDTLQRALADILRVSRTDAMKLVDAAENLGPRTALNGEPLQPWLAATAGAQADGGIGAGHVAVIRDFMSSLPGHISITAREDAENTLVGIARVKRPEELRNDARDLHLQLDQDGPEPTDPKPRATKKGEMHVGPQQPDGRSKFWGYFTPESRATFEAVQAKWAKPGACNPADESPCIDEVSEDAAARDGRSQAQRNHDAFLAVNRAMLASGGLGKHHGLPATVIVSTTLRELEAAAGLGVTAGGTRLPILEVLRLARHAHHYLVIYGDHGEVLHLGRTRRTASPSQQIVLYDRDRGCTRPGCTVPGYGSEAHHAVLDWANGGLTNIDDLAFACPKDNKLVTEGGWTTRKNIFGDTEWIPPTHLDTGQPRVNDYHHPERLRHPRPMPAPDIILEPPPTTGPDDPVDLPHTPIPTEPVNLTPPHARGNRPPTENRSGSADSDDPDEEN